ncbi:hypothetical protein CBL_11835 [Carabus blaptoides fortunei]
MSVCTVERERTATTLTHQSIFHPTDATDSSAATFRAVISVQSSLTGSFLIRCHNSRGTSADISAAGVEAATTSDVSLSALSLYTSMHPTLKHAVDIGQSINNTCANANGRKPDDRTTVLGCLPADCSTLRVRGKTCVTSASGTVRDCTRELSRIRLPIPVQISSISRESRQV